MIIIKKSENKQLCVGLTNAEFSCQCNHPSCRMTLIKPETLTAYEKFRVRVARALTINSGYRCPLHNYHEDGAALSRHQLGEAIDIRYDFSDLLTPEETETLLKECGFTFVLYYRDLKFFHADTREI